MCVALDARGMPLACVEGLWGARLRPLWSRQGVREVLQADGALLTGPAEGVEGRQRLPDGGGLSPRGGIALSCNSDSSVGPPLATALLGCCEPDVACGAALCEESSRMASQGRVVVIAVKPRNGCCPAFVYLDEYVSLSKGAIRCEAEALCNGAPCGLSAGVACRIAVLWGVGVEDDGATRFSEDVEPGRSVSF